MAPADKKTILYLSFAFHVGGIEKMLVDLTAEMAARGHDVLLVIINRDYDEALVKRISPAVHCIRMNRTPGSKNHDFYMRALSRMVTSYHVDILHCQDLEGVLFCSLAKIAHPSLRILHTVHNSFELREASPIKRALSKKLSAATVAVSGSVSGEVRRYMKREAYVIYNGVNTDVFVPAQNAVTKDDRTIFPKIGCVTRLYPEQKGLDLLVQAISLLIAGYPSLRLEIAGVTYKGQEEAVRALKEDIRARGLSDHILFRGFLEDVPSFLQTLDVFVLPSRTEGFGIAIAEALSCGIPCVASKIEGPKEILSGNAFGRLFESGDADALKNALSAVIDTLSSFDPAALHQYVEERFSLKTLALNHEDLYLKLTSFPKTV